MNKGKLVLPCLRNCIGDWIYYSASMTAGQISDRVLAAKDIRETKDLDKILQRDLKKRRYEIAGYLKNKEHRFFNSIIIGVFGGIPDWIPFDIATKMINLGSTELNDESMGILVFNGDEEMFAIDGQHRVAGISIAFKESKGGKFLKDRYPVVFVAHVDDKNGIKRTRRLFSDINKNAKPVAKGDRIKIDEDEIEAIVTRRIYAEYKYFKKGKLISLTEMPNLDLNDVVSFTNLVSLYNVIRELKKITILPEDETKPTTRNVKSLYDTTETFFNEILFYINDYKDYFIKGTLTLEEARFDNHYLLFRPIGLKLIAKLYVYFAKKEKLKYFFKNVNRISFIFPESSLDQILWNKGKMEAKGKNQRLAYDICLYMLNEINDKDYINNILERLREITKDDERKLPHPL